MAIDHDQIMMQHHSLLGSIDAKLATLGTLVETLVNDMGSVKGQVGAYAHFSVSSVADRAEIHKRLEQVERWQSSVEGRCEAHIRLEEKLVEVQKWIEGHQAESKGQAKLWVQVLTIIGLAITAAGVWAEWPGSQAGPTPAHQTQGK